MVEDFAMVAVGRNFFGVKTLANFDWLDYIGNRNGNAAPAMNKATPAELLSSRVASEAYMHYVSEFMALIAIW